MSRGEGDARARIHAQRARNEDAEDYNGGEHGLWIFFGDTTVRAYVYRTAHAQHRDRHTRDS